MLLLSFNNVSSSRNAGGEITLVTIAVHIFMLNFIQRFVCFFSLSVIQHKVTARLRKGYDVNITYIKVTTGIWLLYDMAENYTI
jgi:hypothetical protein